VHRRCYIPFGGTVGTTLITGTPVNLNLGATFVVPASVTAALQAVFLMATASATAVAATLTASGVTFTKEDERSAGNMRVAVFTATGLVMHLDGGIGVFGSVVTIATRTIVVE